MSPWVGVAVTFASAGLVSAFSPPFVYTTPDRRPPFSDGPELHAAKEGMQATALTAATNQETLREHFTSFLSFLCEILQPSGPSLSLAF